MSSEDYWWLSLNTWLVLRLFRPASYSSDETWVFPLEWTWMALVFRLYIAEALPASWERECHMLDRLYAARSVRGSVCWASQNEYSRIFYRNTITTGVFWGDFDRWRAAFSLPLFIKREMMMRIYTASTSNAFAIQAHSTQFWGKAYFHAPSPPFQWSLWCYLF